eukprot:gene10650-13047_t
MNDNDKTELINNYKKITDKIQTSVKSNNRNENEVRLVAVGKTKPSEMIRILYQQGQRHFGENYIQELITKSEELSDLNEIKWHFIGSIQSNKVKMLSQVKNLYAIETIERKEIVEKFAKSLPSSDNGSKLNVMVQVNTSGEESKSGCKPSEVIDLVQSVLNHSDKLVFLGLMTIGSPNVTPDQPDFMTLLECRENVSKTLNIPKDTIQLSMGMSHDFEDAIKFGSTSVRVGTAIFGDRDYSKK